MRGRGGVGYGRRFDGSAGRRIPAAVALLAAGCGAVATGCGDDSPRGTPRDADLLWSQPDGRASIFIPGDLAAASDSVAWVTETGAKVVMRVSPPADEYVMFGLHDREPEEVVGPYLVTVLEEAGVFVYDSATGRVEHLTPDAEHLRGFQVDGEVLLLAASRRPYGLTLGLARPLAHAGVASDHAGAGAPDSVDAPGGTGSVDTAGGDTVNLASPQDTLAALAALDRLLVVRTDFRGASRDTLLDADTGPPALRDAPVAQGRLIATESARGFWAWAASSPDTVYEIAPDGGRRLALRPGDARSLLHMVGDPGRHLLWLVYADTAGGGLRYVGFDVSVRDGAASGAPGTRVPGIVGESGAVAEDGADAPDAAGGREPVLRARARLVAVRRTPPGFFPQAAAEGAVVGWRRSDETGQYLIEAWAMRAAQAAGARSSGRR